LKINSVENNKDKNNDPVFNLTVTFEYASAFHNHRIG